MKTHSRLGPLAWRTALTALLAGLVVTHASACPLADYTGYTRPANVELDGSKKIAKDNKILAAAKDRWEKGNLPREIGGTVYFMVLDRENGVEGDTWGTGVKDFDKRFLASRDCPGGKLDTRARFLYLYQVVNDSGLDGAVYQASVRLLVDPRLITSWGHVRAAKENTKEIEGSSFAISVPDQKNKDKFVNRPVSFEPERQGVTTKVYKKLSPAYSAPKVYSFEEITIATASVRFQQAAGEKELGTAPDKVLLVGDARFTETLAVSDLTAIPVDYRLPKVTEERRWAPLGARSTWSWARDARIRGSDDRPLRLLADEEVLPQSAKDADKVARKNVTWPVIRAYWQDDPLLPTDRSTLFGFTSDLPPAYDHVQVTERRNLGNVKAVADATAVAPAAVGAVPTPVAPVADVVAPPTPDSTGGAVGGGGGAGGMAAGGLGGFPAGFGAGGASGGGGVGGGFGRGGGILGAGGGIGGGIGGGGGGDNGGMTGTMTGTNTGTNTGNQSQNQGQQGGTMLTINNSSVAVANQAQSQSQAQAQSQAQLQAQAQLQFQSQSQRNKPPGPDGNVIPAPPAWLLGMLGLPVFYFIARRRKAKPGQPEEAGLPPDAPGEPHPGN